MPSSKPTIEVGPSVVCAFLLAEREPRAFLRSNRDFDLSAIGGAQLDAELHVERHAECVVVDRFALCALVRTAVCGAHFRADSDRGADGVRVANGLPLCLSSAVGVPPTIARALLFSRPGYELGAVRRAHRGTDLDPNADGLSISHRLAHRVSSAISVASSVVGAVLRSEPDLDIRAKPSAVVSTHISPQPEPEPIEHQPDP